MGRVPVLQDHSRHPRVPRSETARLLFRASGPPCFQVNRSWVRSRGTRKATPHLLAEFAVGVPMHPPIAENQAEVILPVVFAPLGSSSFFGVFVQTSTNTVMVCSPISSPTSRGFCTVKRRRFNDLGEMKTCLQSRCSPS